MKDGNLRPADETLFFGPYSLKPAERLLCRNGEPLPLGGRALDLLIALVDSANQTVGKRELMARVWPNVLVNEESLRFHMKSLRRVLATGGDRTRYIATQVGRGYCFVAPVKRSSSIGPDSAAAAGDRTNSAAFAGGTGSKGAQPSASLRASLPTRLARMVGRSADAHNLQSRVLAERCVTVVGAGGVGKTTLAVAVAHDLEKTFPGRVFFIDLGSLRDSALTSTTVAAALGMSVPTDDPTPSVLAFLRTQRMLLLFDNCEHVIEQAAHLIEAIFQSAPQIHVLATSREALRIEGEHIYYLEPLLSPPDSADLSATKLPQYSAAQLFVDRAQAGGWQQAPSDPDARIIGRICRKLDGLALAIELAAGRVGTFGLGQTASLLDESLGLAWSGRRTAQPRQQTLEATLNWSSALLSPIERHVLHRLSIFVGAFSLDAARSVLLDDTKGANSVIASIAELAAKSLLALEHRGDHAGYRLLETTRAYCMERLRAEPESEQSTLARRHAMYFQRLLERCEASPQDSSTTGRSLPSECLGDVRAALEWSFSPQGDVSIALALAPVASRLFLEMSLLTECRRWCERAVELMRGGSHQGGAAELELQAALGFSLMFTLGNGESVRVALARAFEIATTVNDHHNQIRLLGRLQIFHERIGDFGGSLARAQQAAHIAVQTDDPEARGVASSLLGVTFHLMGNQARARHELETALSLISASQRRRAIHSGFDHRNRAGIALARTLWLQGLPDSAQEQAAATVKEAATLEHPVTHCIALIWAVAVDLWTGDIAQAETHIGKFIAEAEVHSLSPYLAVGMGIKGEIAIRRGRTEWGVTALQECLKRLHAVRYELLTTHLNIALAEGLTAVGRREEALALVEETIASNQANGDLIAMAELLRIKARMTVDGVEAVLRESLEWSRRQDALSWELRTAVDLARLMGRQGRQRAAHDELAPVLSRFTEGFETSDLRSARKLLDHLAGRAGVVSARSRQSP